MEDRTAHHSDDHQDHSDGLRGAVHTLRLAVGLGDPERDRALLPALSESGEFIVAARCLAADQLLASVRGGWVDAAVVAVDLHRLNEAALTELARTGLPLVLLAPPGCAERWEGLDGVVLPSDATSETVRQALLDAIRGAQSRQSPSAGESPVERTVDEPAPSDGTAESPPAPLQVIAIASGPGSPGRTTVAVNLAAALGTVAPTILVDADLFGPSTAASLDLDPTRNLYMLAHAEPATPTEWERALAQETQPLASRCPHADALCGVPKPELRGAISLRFFERLLSELRQRYRYVVLDVGSDLLGSEAAVHRIVLAESQQILLVVATDLVGLWHARMTLGVLRAQLGIAPVRVALLVNRHDRRYHHERAEIEWALELPTAAVIPHDYRAAQRALADQRPLVFDGRSRAGRALLDLAGRVHGGEIALPTEPVPNGRSHWRRWPHRLRLNGPQRSGVVTLDHEGIPHDDDLATVR